MNSFTKTPLYFQRLAGHVGEPASGQVAVPDPDPDCSKTKKFMRDNFSDAPVKELDEAITACCGKLDLKHLTKTGGMQISDDPDCEKALAALALTAVCNYYTGGQCPPCCSKAAAIVGPILATGVQVTLDVLESLWSGVKGAFGDLLGFGEDGPTWTENMNAMMWNGAELLKGPMSASIDAIVKSDVDSKRSLGLMSSGARDLGVSGPLDAILPDNMPGSNDDEKTSSTSWSNSSARMAKLKRDRSLVYGRIDNVEDMADKTMTEALRGQRGFGSIKVMCVPTANGGIDCSFVVPGQKLDDNATFVTSSAMPAGWSIDKQVGWQPNGFTTDYNTPPAGSVNDWVEQYQMVQTAYGMILTERTRAIKDAAMESVGRTIARNVQEAEDKAQGSSSSSSGLGMLAVVAAGIGAAWLLLRRKA